MNDTAQKQDPKVNFSTGQSSNNGISQVNVQKKDTTQTPISSSLNKERALVSDFVKLSEVEPKVEAEVKSAGVEIVSEKPKLDEIHEKIGVKLSPEASEPNLNSSTNVSYPVSEDEAREIIKQNKKDLGIREHGEAIYFTRSIVGLATLVLKLKQKIHGVITGKKQV